MGYLLPATYDLPFASGSATSEVAARKAQDFVGPQGIAVWSWLRRQGATGGTQREASEALHLGRPSICARFHALEQCGEIVKTAGRRRGCVVYVVVE